MSDTKLQTIVKFLSVLRLETDRVPTLSEYRTAFKNLLTLHPDKAGNDTTGEFQAITEAARHVFEFLTQNTDLQPEEIDEEDILGWFVKTYGVVYNSNCVCFDLTADTVDDWKVELEGMLGSSKPLPKKNNKEPGIQYKKDSWSLGESTFGTISVNFYHNTLKVMVQGNSYLDFTTFAIPGMVERMKKKTITAAVVDETENYFDTEESVTDKIENGSKFIIEGFKRMQAEVVTLRRELVKTVDESYKRADDKEHTTLEAIGLKLDKLDTLLNENKAEIAAMNGKIAEIANQNSTVKLDQVTIGELATAVSDTKNTELDEIASTLKEVRDKIDEKKLDDVVESNKAVVAKLESVKNLSDVFTEGMNKLEQISVRDAKNSALSVAALNSMNDHMVSLLAKFDAVPHTGPATATPVAPISSPPSTEPAKQASPPPVTTDVTTKKNERKVRRGKLFSSSVALGCDVSKLEYELNCCLEIFETYHIIENPSAQDPEKYLSNMLKTHLSKDEDEIDFIIVCVGSNDITRLNTDDDIVTLNDKAVEHSKVLSNLAQEVVDTYGIDVFVMERPARYDKKERDPKALKTNLNQAANGMLIPLTNVLEKVHLIKLPSLENLSGKVKKDTFKDDGIHLTNVGLTALEDDLIAGMKTVYRDIKPPSAHSQADNRVGAKRHEHGGRPGGYGRPDWDGPASGRGEHGRPGGRGRPEWDGPAGGRGQQYRGGRQQQQQYGGNYRNNARNWNRDRQEPGMQEMMRDFMAYMNNGPPMYRGRY